MPEGLGWAWNAFEALTTTRDIGMITGPIPWTAIDRYAERYGIDGDAFDRLVMLIRMMDQAARADD